MEAARDDVLAFVHIPQEHWRKVWSTNSLERLNVASRGAVGGQSVAGAAGGMAAGAPPVLLRGHHGPKIPEPEEPLELTDADPSAQPDEPIS
jgi:putative transposase